MLDMLSVRSHCTGSIQHGKGLIGVMLGKLLKRGKLVRRCERHTACLGCSGGIVQNYVAQRTQHSAQRSKAALMEEGKLCTLYTAQH